MLWRYMYKNIKVDMVGDELKMARIYRSQHKREKPHLTVIMTADNNIQNQHCLCTAG